VASGTSSAGTPLYLAPELFRGAAATIQSDIYSLGVLLYRMVSGSYPVRGISLGDLRLAHESRERTGAPVACDNLPRRLRRIIERAIDPSPERRYNNADALAAALATVKPPRTHISIRYAATAAGVVVVVWFVTNGRLRELVTVPPIQRPIVLTPGGAARSDAPAIAVLPLSNLNAEQGNEDFVDGFTEEIINSLSSNQHLQVRSRASSFAFKNTQRDLAAIAAQLHVEFVLDGSVRRTRNRFHIEARLVRAHDGVTVWNDNVEGDLGDLIAIRDRITRGVVDHLGIGPGSARRAYDVNPDVYGRYLTARALVRNRGVDSAQKAVEFFRQVIARDPGFAPAYAGLADAYAYMSLPTYQGMPVHEAQALMRTAALKALELDPNLAEAHAALGIVYARDLNWATSERYFQQALALNPNLSQVYTSYSFFTLRPLMKFDEAERFLSMALRSDPLSLDVWREMAELYFTTGRYTEAIALLERVRAVDAQFPTANVILARALVFGGRIDEALALYDEVDGPAAGVPHYRAYAYVRAGRRSEAEKLAAENDRYPYRATIIYAALGDLDRAFEALTQTAEREPQRVPLLLTWPEMAALRVDPRSLAVRKRFGLP